MLSLESFAPTRGFTARELRERGLHVEGDTIRIPIAGRHGVWYERIHRPGGSPKYESPKGAARHLYNPLGLGPQSEEVWIAEGEFDTLSLITAGVPACGILGTQTFDKHWIHLFAQAEVVLALDPDDAGEKTAFELAGWIEAKGGRWSRFSPAPYADLNEWFVDDRAGFTEAVVNW